ncbi:ARS binding protein Abp2 [Blastomyces dermatitidis ER-3]|uniref:ARS binding protein Abp2 n=1 Tax=Ajellomyces dermatitidis (strain ER-3 / ATCC MYA-2586) TaxID=559297 RepID=A0ABP2F1E3_AJEDR|nr:ARS binding protein Abp2 [Blastomyces dermatitidis ER-3]EEQ90530.2 ARS binding protein Abp2 [Blastomyces dermatitidis ER-3]
MDSSFPHLPPPNDDAPNGLSNGRLIVQQYAKNPSSNDPGLQNISPPANFQNHRLDQAMSPSTIRRETPRITQSSPGNPRSAANPNPQTRSAISTFPTFSVSSRDEHLETTTSVETRSLPSPDITDTTIDDAYVSFILYCNRCVPPGTNTTELRKIFRMPPRSEGKSFCIFTLWQLIQKLDRKELKTWIQLAIELGVEPPSVEKKQSTQKVQQYAVRLKRWMRAMHVDAFFEYCLGHEHLYYTQLTSSTEPNAESRDGVPREEDLALRALFPEWKPKKGRKRAEAVELDDAKSSKRPHLNIPSVGLESSGLNYNPETFPHSGFQQSAIPWSAFPDHLEQHDPFGPHSALTGTTQADNPLNHHPLGPRETDSRWRVPVREISPALQYPQSAIIPRYRDASEIPMSIEPRSAVSPSSIDRVGSRRRRGPAISSAWSVAGNLNNGKTRGRPGASRITQNGPFSTFSVQPKDKHTESLRTDPERTEQNHQGLIERNRTNSTLTGDSESPALAPSFQPHSRPTRLQLQVPQHLGAPVRLATPPTVLVSGENGRSSVTAGEHVRQDLSEIERSQQITHNRPLSPAYGQRQSSSEVDFTLHDVVQAFSVHVHQGTLLNRDVPLSRKESKTIAETVLRHVLTVCSSGLPSNVKKIYCATCLGVGYKLGLGGYPPGQLTITAYADNTNKKQLGTSSTLASPWAGSYLASDLFGGFKYILSYGLTVSTGLTTHTTIPGGQNEELPLAPTVMTLLADDYQSDDDIINEPATEAIWKQRYLNLLKQHRKKDLALTNYKKKILEAVMEGI